MSTVEHAFKIYKDAYMFWWKTLADYKQVEKSGSGKLRIERKDKLEIAYQTKKDALTELNKEIVRASK